MMSSFRWVTVTDIKTMIILDGLVLKTDYLKGYNNLILLV